MSKKSNKTKKTKKKAWITVLVIFVALALFMGGAVTGWYAKDKGLFEKSDKEQTEELPKDKDNKTARSPDVQDVDGNALVSGTVYPMPRGMIMAATTAESASAGEGVTIEATVTPENALEKRVDYTYKFKDPNSEWAQDKTVTEYLSVTPESDGSARAVVKCLAPFAEQILITVTTRGVDWKGEHKTATCTVDYEQKVESVSLKFGTVVCDFGSGVTDVTVELNADVPSQADRPVLEITYSNVYTIAAQLTPTYTINSDYRFMAVPTVYADSYYEETWNLNHSCFYFNAGNLDVEKVGLSFSMKFFMEQMGFCYYNIWKGNVLANKTQSFSSNNVISNFSKCSQAASCGGGDWGHLEMFDLTLTLNSAHTRTVYEKTTTFRMTAYTNTVSDVEVNPPNMVV